ncbi:hypothetical protein [Sulfurimonas sp.]|uniref:hypothetical protein n=1 Tax=Sulfurimonas sp. TaxID=2022749 RepID=UPI003D114408
MQNRILLVLTFLSTLLFAELPPYYYKNLQNASQENLIIEVNHVHQSISILSNNIVLDVNATVLKVQHSQSNLQKGDTIRIKYSRVLKHPTGWVGPSEPLILEERTSYKAYLKQFENSKLYLPDARGKSFEQQ